MTGGDIQATRGFLPVLLGSLLALASATGCSSLSEEEQASLDSYKQRSKEYYASGYYERAQDQCRKGLSMDSADQSLMQVLGYTLLKQTEPRDSWDRRLQEAAGWFENAIEAEDDFDFRNRVGLGEVLTKTVLLRLAKIDEVSADAKLTAEERDRQLNKLTADVERCAFRADEALHEVLDRPRTKDNDLALSTLARLKSQTDAYDLADELLARLNAVLTRSIHLRGQQLDIENWPAEVKIAVRQDIDRIKQTRVDALKLRTNVLSKLGRPGDVITTYEEIEAEKAMQPADYFNRGDAREQIGDFDGAIQDYDTFITLAAKQGSGLSDPVRRAMDRKAELQLRRRANSPAP